MYVLSFITPVRRMRWSGWIALGKLLENACLLIDIGCIWQASIDDEMFSIISFKFIFTFNNGQ